MHAMRRHAHNLLAALLCMCLLISYTPLPASAAEGDYSPSVSDQLGEAESIGDGKAQMSTTVSILTIPALAITSQTEDYAAKIDDIKADADKYDLKVAVTGQEPFAYAWTRTVDGKADAAFSFEGSATYPLSQHTDTLKDGSTYVYTVVVKDQSGEEASASIKVTVSSAYAEKTFPDEERGISVMANAHYSAVLSTGDVAEGTDTYTALQQAASGGAVAGAWTIELGSTVEGAEPFVGKVSVSLPVEGVPADAEVFVVGLDATGESTVYDVTVADGKAVFDAAALGAFAVAYKVPAEPTFILTPSVEGGNGQIDPSEAVEVAKGGSFTFKFRPDDTYVVDAVKVDDVPVDASKIVDNSYKFENVEASHAISVSFKKVDPQPTQHTVSARVEGGNGKVQVQGGTAGASAQAQVAHGEQAAVTFLPDTGYAIDTVTMKTGDGAATSVQPTSANELSISAVEDDIEVTVTYKSGSQPPVQKFTVTATASEGGSIEPPSAEVARGGSTEFTVQADAGYRLKSLTIDGEDAMGKLDGVTLKVSNVIKDCEVVATFEVVPGATFTVTAGAGEGGAISPDGSQTVAAGSSLTFYVHPDEGSILKKLELSEDGGASIDVTDRVVGGVFVLDNVQANSVLTASFEESGIVVPEDTYYSVSASAGEGGSISPAGSVRVKAGSSQTFHFLPDEGYKLAKVEVNGQPVAVSALSYTMQAVAANATIAASFEPVGDGPKPDVPATHDITATSGAGGTVSPSGTVQVLHGGSMSFAFIPYAGYEVDEVHVNGQPLDDEAVAKGVHRFDNVVDDGNKIHATFKVKAAEPADPDYYTLTVDADDHGTVAPLGTTRVSAGAVQTLYAYPDEGYVVDQVLVTRGGTTVDRAQDLVDGTSLALEMTADAQVSVKFREAKADQGEQTPDVRKFTLSSSASAGGSISPAGAVEVAEGGSLAYTVAAEAGYLLDKVTVNGSAVAVRDNGFVVSDVAENMQVRAEFKAEPTVPADPTYRTVNATAGEGGAISPAGAVRVAAGKAQTFYFYPNEGYALEGVYVDGSKVETATANSYTFASVEEDATIEARFRVLGSTENPPAAPETFVVTASASTGGTVSPAGSTRVEKGGDLLLTLTPDEGYQLESVLLDGYPTELVAGDTLRLTGVVEDHTVRAVFERASQPEPDAPQRYTVTAGVKNGGGSISPSGETVVAVGSSQTFYFAPDANKQVKSVTVDGATFDWPALSYTLANIAANASIEVEFADVPAGEKPPVLPTMRTISAQVEGQGGTVSPAGATQVADGGSLTLTFTPDAGYELESVKVGDRDALADVSANGTLRLDGIDADATVTAKFAAKAEEGPSGDDYRTVSVSSSAGGAISPTGDVRVARGAGQTFTFVPEEGMHLASLMLGEDEMVGQVANGVFVLDNVQDDCTLRAEFAPDEQGGDYPAPPETTHAVKAFGTTGGTVSPSGVTTVAEGADLTLTFTPDAGYELGRVTVNEGDVTSGVKNGVYVLEDVSADMTVFATFVAKQPVDPQPSYHTVTVSVDGGHGSVSPAGSTRVKDGASQTFLLAPDQGYVLDKVMVDDRQAAADGYLFTLVNVQKDTEVKVSYRAQDPDNDPDPVLPASYDVTVQATIGGSVSPSGTFQAAAGTSPLLTIAAEAGYQLAGVTVNGDDMTESVADGSLRLPPITGNVSVAVAFERMSAPEPAPADPVITATAGEGGSISPAGQMRVARGSSQTFSLIPDEGYAVDSLTVGGSTFPFSGASYTLFNIERDTAVSVAFKKEEGAKPPVVHAVSASSTAGGEIVPEGDVPVVEGAGLSVSFAPYAGYELYRVVVDEQELTAQEMAKGFYRFADVRGDHAIRAFFAPAGTEPDPDDPDKPTGYAVIDATAGDGGSIEPSGAVKVLLGEDKTFEFKPQEGYQLDDVLVNGQSVKSQMTGLTYTFENVRAAASIHASFKSADEPPAPTTYHIQASASSGGSIDPSGSIPVDAGQSRSFSIEADAGFELAYLLIDGGRVEASEATDGTYTFVNVQADHTIRAMFQATGSEPVEPDYTVVHAVAGAGGTISPAGDVRVQKGDGIAFVMLPREGYKLQDVEVNGVSAMSQVRDGCRLALEGVEAETFVVATFAEVGGGETPPVLPTTHSVRATSTSGGTIAPRGTVQVVDGDSVSFAVTPEEGYFLAKLVVDGADVSADEAADGTYTFQNVKDDRSVRAVFERVEDGPAPEEPPFANVDVEVKVKVSAESVSNGGGIVQPDFISVPRGAQNLPFYVYPDAGHTLEAVSVNGAPVEFHAVDAASSQALASRAAVFSASAPGAAGAFWFTVAEANEDLVIEVTFRPLDADDPEPTPVHMHRIDASAAAGGSISPSGASLVPDGGQVVFGVKPDQGYRLSSLKVTEGGAEREAKGEVVNGLFVVGDVHGDVSVRALFEPEGSGPVDPAYKTVHASAGQGGKVSPSGDVRVSDGESQTFSFVPDEGYTLDKVYLDGSEVQVEGFSITLSDLESDTDLHATFRLVGGGDKPVPTFYDVTISSGTHGRVWPSGVVSVEEGKSISVKIAPDAGYETASVKVDGVEAPRSEWADGTFVLENVASNMRVEVAFSKIVTPEPGQVLIRAEAGPNGSISPSGAFSAEKGATIDFTFAPDEGYAVDKVTVNGVEKPFEGTSYRLFEVAEDTTVYVTFKEDGGVPPVTTHIVTAIAGQHGSIVPAGPQTVVHGDDQLFEFKPFEGFEVDAVAVDGIRVENPGTSYLFEDVQADHEIRVTFCVAGSEPAPPVEEPVYFTIEASVAGAHGRISPEGAIPVERGKARTFQFLPDAGYQVSALSIDGESQPFNGTSYRFVDVQADHAIEVAFSAVTAPAPATPIDTVSRTAQKAVGYVKTGDANSALAVSFVVLAAVAGIAALTARRRADQASGTPRVRSGRGDRR